MACASSTDYEKFISDDSDEESAEVMKITDNYPIRYGTIISERFKLIKYIGSGGFSHVAKAKDLRYNRYVALKIIKKSPKYKTEALNEISLMKKVNEYVKGTDQKQFFATYLEHLVWNDFLFISIELLSMSLADAINYITCDGLPLTAIRSISYQLFQGLSILSRPELNIIHGDLKPDNIIFSNRREYKIKICDFGCAQIENQQIYSQVGTPYYRAPEVMLKMDFGRSIDMWSTGCIIAEAFIGKILLMNSNINPFIKLVELFGMPPNEMLDRTPVSLQFFTLNMKENNFEYEIFGTNPSPNDLNGVLFQAALESNCNIPDIHDELVKFQDLLNRIFVYDSEVRISPEEALSHAFIAEESKLMVAKELKH